LLEEFQERDSGWTLSYIFNLTINVNKYNPLWDITSNYMGNYNEENGNQHVYEQCVVRVVSGSRSAFD